MTKIGAVALLGFLTLPPVAQAAGAPAFVSAALCEAAAPSVAARAVLRRQVRAERPVAQRPIAQRPVAQAREGAVRGRRAAARPAPRPVDEAPALDGEAVLRPAVHFCVTPADRAGAVRYT